MVNYKDKKGERKKGLPAVLFFGDWLFLTYLLKSRLFLYWGGTLGNVPIL